MMIERRQATRREPIEVVISDGNSERVFTARPLPWTQANDLGDEVVRQNADSMNDFLGLYTTDAGLPQLEFKLKEKIRDWNLVLKLAYPENNIDDFTKPRVLDVDECATLVIAALEVNHLEHIRHLVDPNSPTPTLDGGTNSSEEAEGITLGQKMESTPDSESSASVDTTPSILQEASSSAS